MTPRRNLVVLRAGPNSLHRAWLDRPYAERDFDLLLSYYSAAAHAAFRPEPGVSAVLVPGGKWDGLYQTLAALDLSRWDHVWLPDDDIATTTRDINHIFALCRSYGLAVAQPALTTDSYFSHPLFLRCPGFRLRFTNYIEVMVPCLSRAVLQRALPHFADSKSGYGLDYIWCRWPESGAFRAAILDQVAVHHTRPVGRVLKAAMQAQGAAEPEVEEARLRARFGLTRRTVPLAFAGLRQDGRPLIGRLTMAWAMWRAWTQDAATSPEPKKLAWGRFKVLRRQLVKRLDMTVVNEVAAAAPAPDPDFGRFFLQKKGR